MQHDFDAESEPDALDCGLHAAGCELRDILLCCLFDLNPKKRETYIEHNHAITRIIWFAASVADSTAASTPGVCLEQ